MSQSITLQTSDSGVVASEVLGRISFAASNESSGSDAILVGANIYAKADAEFTATDNPTSIVFGTSSTGAVTDRIIIDNSGNLKPASDNVYDLGNGSLRFANLYAFNSNTDVIGAIKIGCKNSTGSTINAGVPVYISGHFANGKVYIDVARADTSTKMPAIGILASGLGNESEGDVYIFGTVSSLNTNGFTAGTTLYVAPTGGFTSTKPTGVGELIQNMGRVARADLTNGRIILLGPGRSNDIPNSGNFQQLTVQGNPVSTGVSGSSGGATVYNSGDNRVLTSDGSTSGINAEGNFTFNGSFASIVGSGLVASGLSVSGSLTVSNTGVFSSGITINSQTASTIASFDANKNIISLSTATYPTLTELSYVKGVTSAIQTQIDSKAANTVTLTAGSGLVGGGTLAANRTFDIGQGDGITVAADTIAVDSTVVRTTGTQTIPGAKTFQSSTVFNSGVQIDTETASTIASFDTNKKVVSLSTATYPTLTELSYVKGVTSAIQTQLNTKTSMTTATSGDNRVITSDGSVTGLVGEGNLTFNGSVLNVTGSGLVASGLSVSGSLTVSNTGVFSSGVTINSQTASTIASFDANKNVVSLSTATYPTLTELSYVKGVTSAIQTQLNAKQATLTNPVTGTGTTSYIPKFTGTSAIGNSVIYDDGTNIGIGTTGPSARIHVMGSGFIASGCQIDGTTRSSTFVATSTASVGSTATPAQLYVLGSGLIASGCQVSGTLTTPTLVATTGVISNYAGTIDTPAGGRLTLTAGNPTPSGDVTGATTIYYSPYVNNRVALYDSTNSRWQLHTFSEVSLALGTLISGRNYDVFLYDNAGTKTLEAVSWTGDNARTTALATQDNVYVKSGATARRYVGTFRTTSTTTTEDSATKRFVWNMDNREPEILFANPAYNDNNSDTTYTLTGASVTALNGGTGSKTEMVCGLQTIVEVQVRFCGNCSAAGGTTVGVGIDQITNIDWGVNCRASEFIRGVSSKRDYTLTAGYHAFNLLGINTASATNTINADYARNFSGTADLIGTAMTQTYLG